MPTTVGTLVAGIVMLMAGVTTASSTPEQVHLSVAAADPASGYPSGMTVMWYTQDSTSASSCQFGLGGLLNRTAQGTATSYLVGEGFHHTVHLTGLRPEAKYTYRVGSDGDAWSDTFSFTSPPHRDDASFGIAMFGDMGWLGSQERPMVITLDGLVKNWTAVPTRARLEALKDEYQMVWALGDLAYADDAFAHDPIKFECGPAGRLFRPTRRSTLHAHVAQSTGLRRATLPHREPRLRRLYACLSSSRSLAGTRTRITAG